MYEHLPNYLVALIHVIGTFIATSSLFYAMFLMRRHKKEFSRFKKARVGDPVKFNMSCQTDDCIFSGKITDVKGPIVEIQTDPTSHGWHDCEECIGRLRKVNKPYQEVIF